MKAMVGNLLEIGLRDPGIPMLLENLRRFVWCVLAQSIFVNNFVARALVAISLCAVVLAAESLVARVLFVDFSKDRWSNPSIDPFSRQSPGATNVVHTVRELASHQG